MMKNQDKVEHALCTKYFLCDPDSAHETEEAIECAIQNHKGTSPSTTRG